ncbi:Rieske (2Fe-2S) protein [Petropleomorpha daqingensis]|uniref:Cytochrome bc1 complex Rieske iron-sulfur subunit n=1 Tax=Petropleomorpha daqingensis TaxID=2026353 RepID=A0A853CCD0_9ACTN|nr:Rieske Fe-S protein [Petropleomorpha daqingensis]
MAGTGALVLGTTACSTYGTPTARTSAPSGGDGNGGAPLAKTDDIPVGGGKIFPDQQVVVTEPADGEFKAFSAVCTHQGCLVDAVSGGTINCPCHGSRYKITDGSVVRGPATRPLAPKSVVVQGDSLVVS